MPDQNNFKDQRDRFLAFAFASADLFLEVGGDGKILYATGAAKVLTGGDNTELPGQNWLDLFTNADRSALQSMMDKARPGSRCIPCLVLMNVENTDQQAIVTGITMPETDSFYVTIGIPSLLMRRFSQTAEDIEAKPLDKDSFLQATQEALNTARSLGQDIDMTLLDIPDAAALQNRFGEEAWENFTGMLSEFLSARSADGHTMAMIGEGRYGLIHDKTVDAEILEQGVQDLSKEADPDGEGFTVEGRTVSADLQALSERETMKALVYTINEFERRGSDLNIENLNDSFKTYVSVNAQKIQQLKSIIGQLNFEMHFQPVVELGTDELSHFEMLARFRSEGTTQEWIMFAEDVGLAPDLDLAVCERAMNYIHYKANTNRFVFAVNLSGQSIQQDEFCESLLEMLSEHKNLHERLVFEITESSTIDELEKVNNYISVLQKKGFKVCLDDFGAGAASFQYLQQLHVDYVKIDGQYTQKCMSSERDAAMIKNLVQMCRDLEVKTVAERVETTEEAKRMKNLGVDLGQGWLFGKPEGKPAYDPPEH